MSLKRICLAAVLCVSAVPAVAQEPSAAGPGRVFELAEVEAPPRPVNTAELREALNAAYPAELREAGRQGTVTVSLVVTPEGEARDVRVVSSTDAAFDAATVGAMARLRFTPATVGGAAVAVRVEVPIQWQPASPAQEVAAAPAEAAEPAGEPSDGVPVYELQDVDEAPRPLNVSAMQNELMRRYPVPLRDAGIGGLVQVSFVVTEEGTVEDVLVTRTSDLRFNVPTVQTVSTLRFRPGRVNGRAVRTQVELPIRWEAEPREVADDRGADRYSNP